MTVSVTTSYTRAAGNGVTTVFNFAFKIFSASDLVVRDIPDSSGVPTTKTLTTDYNVTLSSTGQGGTVTMVTAPAAGHTLDIRSLIPLTQAEDIRNQGRFLPELHEGVFDKLERQIQDLSRRVDASFRFPDYGTTSGELTTPLSAWFSKYLTLDASGNLVPAVLSSTTVTASILQALLAATPTSLGIYPRTAAEIAAGIIPADYSFTTKPYDIRRYGADKAASNATNKAALQSAISVVSSEGATSGGIVIVPPDVSYGYKITDSTTWPSFTSCLSPCVVLDYGPGNSFAGYPTAYDGAQLRQFYFTPQTKATVTFTAGLSGGATSATLTGNWALTTGPWPVTFSNGDVRYVTLTNGATTATWTGGLSGAATSSATYVNFGQHQGNQQVIRGSWNPGLWLQSDGVLDAPGGPTRTALDNRRAQLGFGVNGDFRWNVGQGTLIGPAKTDEELTNFVIEKLPVAGDTVGHFNVVLAERKTGNMGFGLSSNVPDTSFDFVSVSAGVDQMKIENGTDVQSRMFLRSSAGSASDGGVGVDSSGASGGNLFLWFRSTGHALDVDKTSRTVTLATALKRAIVAVSYSPPTIAFSASAGEFCVVAATNNTACAVSAPTNAQTGVTIKLVVRNTSGGALGVWTFNAVFKMPSNTPAMPANGFSRTWEFYYDGTNWIQNYMGVDVPN